MRRKRFFATIMIFIVLASVIYLYFAVFTNSPLGGYVNPSPEEQENGTTPWKFPKFTFPWSSGDKNSGGGGGSLSGGGGEGGSNVTLPKNNFTLFINSTHDLQVLVKYTANDVVYSETERLPFSLDIQEKTYACLSETTGSGTIRWLLSNGTDCPFSDCGGTLYDCELYMNSNYSVTVRQYS
jgi:hypothetical protein